VIWAVGVPKVIQNATTIPAFVFAIRRVANATRRAIAALSRIFAPTRSRGTGKFVK
jgi:hypothetical protein